MAYGQFIEPTVFSLDSERFLFGASNGTIHAWDTENWTEETFVEGLFGEALCLALSPDGKILAAGTSDVDEPIVLFHTESRERLRSLVGHTHTVTSIAFSPDGNVLASGSGYFDGTIRFWDVSSERELFHLPKPVCESGYFAWSPDGKSLVSVGRRGEITLWDVDLDLLTRAASQCQS